MKVSLSWLKELVDFNLFPQQLADQLSLKSIGVKQATEDFLELDLTYNRGDLLSLRGIAREAAAITDSKICFNENNHSLKQLNLPNLKVNIENQDLCPVYCVVKIENLKVEESNDIWRKKLSESGIRAVNNIADVTNLIMMEYGQPMHAFDAGKVKGDIKVRNSQNNERITTLDGKTRNLSDDLLIADDSGAIGIAGVMGGKKSEVSDITTSILLEAAIFDPVSIRNTSKRHGLYSEASKRFQHGLTKTNLLEAFSAAIKMYAGLGGKLTAITLAGDLEDKPKVIDLSQEKVNSLLGIKIPEEQIKSSLKSLGVKLFHLPGCLKVIIPFWRLDLNIEEDLIEEIARMYGYEKIEGQKLKGSLPSTDYQLQQSLPKFIYDLKLKLKEIGLTEVQTYSFYSSAVLQALGLTKEDISSLLRIANPISSETEYLRQDLWPNLIEVVGKNIRKGYKDIGIFEIGKVYSVDNKNPKETYRLSVALMNNTDNPIEELSVVIKNLGLHLRGVKPMNHKGSGPYTPNSIWLNPNYFHPKRIKEGMGEIHLRLLNRLGIEKRAAVMEIDIDN